MFGPARVLARRPLLAVGRLRVLARRPCQCASVLEMQSHWKWTCLWDLLSSPEHTTFSRTNFRLLPCKKKRMNFNDIPIFMSFRKGSAPSVAYGRFCLPPTDIHCVLHFEFAMLTFSGSFGIHMQIPSTSNCSRIFNCISSISWQVRIY